MRQVASNKGSVFWYEYHRVTGCMPAAKMTYLYSDITAMQSELAVEGDVWKCRSESGHFREIGAKTL